MHLHCPQSPPETRPFPPHPRLVGGISGGFSCWPQPQPRFHELKLSGSQSDRVRPWGEICQVKPPADPPPSGSRGATSLSHAGLVLPSLQLQTLVPDAPSSSTVCANLSANYSKGDFNFIFKAGLLTLMLQLYSR